MDRISSQPRDRRQAVLLSLLGLLGPGLAAPAALGAVIEGGQVGSIGPAETVNHSFDQSFGRTPFVFTMPTTEGQAPRSVRVDQVTRDGFTIRQTEPTEVAAADDPAAMTNVPYLAIEPGQHELATAGGTPVRIEAFNHRTTSTVLSNSGNHDAIELRHQGFHGVVAVVKLGDWVIFPCDRRRSVTADKRGPGGLGVVSRGVLWQIVMAVLRQPSIRVDRDLPIEHLILLSLEHRPSLVGARTHLYLGAVVG